MEVFPIVPVPVPFLTVETGTNEENTCQTVVSIKLSNFKFVISVKNINSTEYGTPIKSSVQGNLTESK